MIVFSKVFGLFRVVILLCDVLKVCRFEVCKFVISDGVLVEVVEFGLSFVV